MSSVRLSVSPSLPSFLPAANGGRAGSLARKSMQIFFGLGGEPEPPRGGGECPKRGPTLLYPPPALGVGGGTPLSPGPTGGISPPPPSPGVLGACAPGRTPPHPPPSRSRRGLYKSLCSAGAPPLGKRHPGFSRERWGSWGICVVCGCVCPVPPPHADTAKGEHGPTRDPPPKARSPCSWDLPAPPPSPLHPPTRGRGKLRLPAPPPSPYPTQPPPPATPGPALTLRSILLLALRQDQTGGAAVLHPHPCSYTPRAALGPALPPAWGRHGDPAPPGAGKAPGEDKAALTGFFPPQASTGGFLKPSRLLPACRSQTGAVDTRFAILSPHLHKTSPCSTQELSPGTPKPG